MHFIVKNMMHHSYMFTGPIEFLAQHCLVKPIAKFEYLTVKAVHERIYSRFVAEFSK